MTHTRFAALAVILFFSALAASGCAVGNQYDFANSVPAPQVSADKSVAVSAHDRRQSVTSGECEPNYVGMQRAGAGNPWRVHTKSGNPFVQDVAGCLAEALNKNGFKAETVMIEPPTPDQNQAAQILLRSNAERYLLVTVNKWESDTYNNIGLDYDLHLTVYNPDGQVLAENTTADDETITGSAWNPPAAARKKIPEAYKRILEDLLNDSEVADALKQ